MIAENKREIYISNKKIALCEHIPSDDKDCYDCWLDEETQRGYNYAMKLTFEEYSSQPERARFIATIIRHEDDAPIGGIFLSPEGCEPDLAIMIYPPHRGKGFGTVAFSLGVSYCLNVLDYDHVYAGCYEGNIKSRKMLEKCGFIPHPEGNADDKHYITGENIIQYDFVKYREVT